MERIILHIDVNSAFLSWSALKRLSMGDKTDIRKEISVIAGDPKKRHGVIVAASIPAKRLGIKPPTNISDARKIYKDLIIEEPDFEFYKMKSNQLISLLNRIFDKVEQASIDECYVDYTDYKDKYGDEIKFAYKLKDFILEKFGFTVNVGIGNNKLSAKMASDFEKPNKVHTLYKYEYKDKVWNLDISDLYMAGKASCEKLRKLGINTIGELANFNEDVLITNLKSFGSLLYNYANGIDDSPVENRYNERKSIGYSKTLPNDSANYNQLVEILKEFSYKLSNSLQKKELYTNTIKVTIRNKEFKTISHQKKYVNSFNDYETILKYAIEVFNQAWDEESVRLLGVTAQDLEELKHIQLSFKDIDEYFDLDDY